MDVRRVQEIINSPTMINVNYHGIPVFLKEVHAQNNTVTIFPLDEMKNKQVVDIEGLVELGP
ncbi:H-type small acid-soluble spore protein [Lederbergia wuyishanensis]|uniref:Small, acid-soluble spore protein H n=1 Tax=Lederbergia wuyishanensis TaxID=1347903 RepID=A0ABU0D5U2_9BACI|nr:H-type small acid-soluble spore protein [Lederbergia wuyishanensis]MCJ8008360.1 H-type small acid-soluble spore protein [Lederbergia wuyishanensis]MDQ0343774.1 small acid-soluble spore protein H (minor) [Lederbergia wuyishanensis]